eukprot:697641-Prymnesium_polylepis.1
MVSRSWEHGAPLSRRQRLSLAILRHATRVDVAHCARASVRPHDANACTTPTLCTAGYHHASTADAHVAQCLQVRSDATVTGDNASTADHTARGRLYAQALLNELGLGEYKPWLTKSVTDCDSDQGLQDVVNTLFRQLHRKVSNGERWTNLPAGSVGGSERDIPKNATKVIGMALKADVDAALRDTTGRLVPVGYLQTFSWFKDTEKLLKKHGADQAVAAGTEAKQPRDKELWDHEQLALFESILSCSVAEKQRLDGVKDAARRHPTDTLTLGVIVALHFPLGQRCLNVRTDPPLA